MKRLLEMILATSALFAAAPALADTSIETVPNGWRLQNYVGGDLKIFFTGSPCGAGQLRLAGTDEEKNRLWALILTAKASGKSVGIFYETSSGACNITSFYMS